MELKANELRIGNLVKRKYWNPTWINPSFEYQTCRIVALGKENAIVVDINGKSEFKIPYRDLQPIPLTEEWLLRFGFGKSDEHEYGSNEHDLFGFYYDYHFNKFYLDTPEDNIYIPFIKYVHQLQNIYFSLTNTELNKIK